MAISSAAFANISNGNLSSVSNLVSSAASTKDTDKEYSTDQVSLSQEALELVAEYTAQRSKKVLAATGEKNEFATIAKGLPSTENFTDMVEWLTTWSGEKAVNLAKAPDRNVYIKNPKKYVTMWKNLYENYNVTMKKLGLNPSYSAHRDALKQDNVSSKVQYFFNESLTKETKNLMKMFNITI